MRRLKENIETHNNLNPDLFDDGVMIDEVRDKLLEIANRFIDELYEDEIKFKPTDICLVGSSASYNYTEDSDIDVHIVADMSQYEGIEDLAEKVYNAYRQLWNNKYEPTIYGHEVELYIEPDKLNVNSNGIYSIINNEWLKVPNKENIPEIDHAAIDVGVNEFVDKYNAVETKEDIENLIDELYKFRQDSILQGGEYSIGNLVFKEFRNQGYLKDLKKRKTAIETREMSL